MKKTSRKETARSRHFLKTKRVKRKRDVEIKNIDPVYLKITYDEAIKSKKDLLLSELSLLTILKIIKEYRTLRTEKFRLKSNLYKAIRELDLSIRKTKSVFPFLKIPEKLKRKEIAKIENVEEIKPAREIVFDEDLESQLKNIQERLKSVGR